VVLAVAATTTVVAAFCIPLALLLRDVAHERAIAAAERDAHALVASVWLTSDLDLLEAALDQVPSGRGERAAVHLPDGSTIGLSPPAVDAVDLAAASTRPLSVWEGGDLHLLHPVAVQDGTAVVQAVVPRAELERGVTRAWVALGGVAVALVAVGVVLADRLGRSVSEPIGSLAAAAGRLGAGDLDVQVVPGGPREVAALGTTFDQLVGRVGQLLDHQRTVAADLSHRLRTPLTALRLDAEAVGSDAERARVLADVDSLERTVNAVITEARRPQRQGVRPVADLAEVVRRRGAFWEALAQDQGRPWEVEVTVRSCPVGVPRADLEAAVDALLGNVFSHTPEGTGARILVDADGGVARLVVRDDGPGFGARASGPGTGLGLDIVRRTAVAAGGRMEVSPPGPGATVTVVLPRLG
jgi:signal transduction histidine kinase